MKSKFLFLLALAVVSALSFAFGARSARVDAPESVTVENGVSTYHFTVTAKAIR